MKLLLTGATGRVGRHLLPRLVAQGHDVRAVARGEVAAEHVKAAGAEPVLADLLDPDGYRAALGGRDAVVHLAAVLRSTDADEIRLANLEATRRLAGAALAAGVGRFVFTSTNLVYPGGLGRPASEDDQPAPPPAWAPTRPPRPRPSGPCSPCTTTGAWACGSSAWRSSTGRATPTWPSRSSGRAGGPGTSGCTCSTTPTPPRR
jgi:nucleoside-diphosphate-sugar epimerase